MTYPAHSLRVMKLYRHSLKNLMNWAVHRDLFIERGFELRAQFDANKGITDAKLIERAVSAGEAKLAEFTHPDPYTRTRRRPPSARAPRPIPNRPPACAASRKTPPWAVPPS